MTTQTLILPARCDRPAAHALLPELQRAVATGDVVIDGEAVTQLGQAMLQLLLSARASVASHGHKLTITASEAMRATLAMVDADRLIDGGTPR